MVLLLFSWLFYLSLPSQDVCVLFDFADGKIVMILNKINKLHVLCGL